MFRQILLTSVIRNVWRSVMRICIFISGLKGLSGWTVHLNVSTIIKQAFLRQYLGILVYLTTTK